MKILSFFLIFMMFLGKSFAVNENIKVYLKASPISYSGTCPVKIKFEGTIEVSEPTTVQYQFLRNDGAVSMVKTIKFKKPGKKRILNTWTLNLNYTGYQVVKILYPYYITSNKASFKAHCEQSSISTNLIDDDKDKDGISDKFENQLLKRFRPFYKFTKNEHYLPTNAVYQIRYAQLLKDDWTEGLLKPDIEKNCAGGEDNHIKPPFRLLSCLQGKLNLIKNPKKTNYFLNLNDGKRKDPGNGRPKDWKYVKRNTPGLYGHVVKDGKLIKIEYWQFFAYNGQDIHGGDHEGDWATVQLWYDKKTDKIVKTCHWTHGKGICFNLRRSIKKHILTVPGQNFFFVKFIGPNYNKKLKDMHRQSRYPKNYQNHHVSFFVEKKNPKDLHVVVYIEKDGHEFWPFPEGNYKAVNKHRGDGIAFLTAYVPRKINLGELSHPLNKNEIILRFNGYWGAWHHGAFGYPPPGPTLHCQWKFPENEKQIAKKIRKYCEH